MQGTDQIFDKRTLLAFALMGVVWMGWFAIFPQTDPEQDDATGPDGAEVASADVIGGSGERTPLPDFDRAPQLPTPNIPDDETLTIEPGSADPGAWAQTSVSDRGIPIVISTPLIQAEIDPVGGDLLSWELRRYDLVDGTPVDLVGPRTLDPGTQHAHALRVLLEDRALDLRNVSFDASRLEIVLSEGDEPAELTLRAQRNNGGMVELVYRFFPDRYGFDVDARLTAGSGERLPLALQISWPGGIAATEPDSSAEYKVFRSVTRIGDEVHKHGYAGLRKGDGSKARREYEGSISWAGVESSYFLAAVIDQAPQLGRARVGGDGIAGVQTFSADLGFEGQSPTTVQYSVYMGPIDSDVLVLYDGDPWNAEITQLVDLGPKIFRWVAEGTLAGLRLLNRVVPNWGLTIILFSVFTKLLFWPLTKSSTKSMKKMQEIQPKMKKLQAKHKEDPQRQSKEMMKLYKEHGVNPLNMGGCLPLVVQMPVFWALFTILRRTIDLRQAEFGLWITDLSQPDMLAQLPFTLPVFGDKLSLLPILMAIGMWAQTKLQQPAGAAQSDNAMAQQMKMMTTLMPVMMFVFFYKSPSGLVLYWLVNTALTAFQTWRIHSSAPPAQTAEAS